MPQINFKKEFVPKILAGEKPFTLRALRKDGHDAQMGQKLYMFTGLRSKQCKKFAEKPCMFAVTIKLGWHSIFIPIMGSLGPYRREVFSKFDGFDDYFNFCQFHEINEGMIEKEMRLVAWITRGELKDLLRL